MGQDLDTHLAVGSWEIRQVAHGLQGKECFLRSDLRTKSWLQGMVSGGRDGRARWECWIECAKRSMCGGV